MGLDKKKWESELDVGQQVGYRQGSGRRTLNLLMGQVRSGQHLERYLYVILTEFELKQTGRFPSFA